MSYWYKSAFWIIVIGLVLAACAPLRSQDNPTETPSPTPLSNMETPTFLPTEAPPRGAEREFTTNFSKHNVSYSDILSGGPPKDGIPAIDNPQYVSVSEADDWLADREPVVFVAVDDETRAYPIQILMWHEIVNDSLGGKPLVVSFCPLCNTAIAFERTVNGQVFDFGTTGRLRFSNLIMYDRQTESWWQQATGDAIAGELTGTQLTFYPASLISWEDFKIEYPGGSVLSRETGYLRDYGRNPYTGYDDINQSPFLYKGDPTPGQLSPMARVLTIEQNGETVAYPYDVLSKEHVINDSIGGEPLIIFWVEGTASALDSGTVAGGRDVGAATAYYRLLEDNIFEFTVSDNQIRDKQTDSTWNVLGQAIDGELKGEQLVSVVSINHFWFSWAAFRPETRIYQP